MIGRRFLAYFVAVTALLAVVTALYVRYSLGRAVDHSVARNLLFARSISQYLGARVEEDGKALEKVLAGIPDDVADAGELGPMLDAAGEGLLGRARVVILDGRGRVLAGNLEPNGLAPPRILLPALRRAREAPGNGPVVTDLWLAQGGKPRVSLVVADGVERATPRFAVAQVPLDSEDFLRVFGYFLVARRAALQLLDSEGTALFSTRADERFRSAVHGTFFVDKVRIGEPAVMTCHSCHEGRGEERVAERMVTTVAPVPHTSWAISVLENERDVYATMRELVLSSVGLVTLFFGGFAAFYVVLSHRVLRPMRDLARAAAAISSGQAQALPITGANDEFSVLARSFEQMQRRVSGPVPGAGTRRADPELVALLDEVIGGLTRLEAVKCAGLAVTRGGDAPILVARKLELRGPDPTSRILQELPAGRSWIALSDLARAGVEVVDAGGAEGFFVRELRAGDGDRGFLWIGVDDPGAATAAYLSPAIDVLARQVESLLERTRILERLRREHELKGKMLRRLFDAEDEERRRIARELHDETAQLLTSLLVHFETFPAASEPEKQDAALGLARRRVQDLLAGIQRLIQRLRPAVLDDLGLVEALRSLGRNVLAPAGVAFDLALDDDASETPVPPEVENAVYRVFQEAATNVVRHAAASRVQASLDRSREGIRASFEDDGKGMDLSWLSDATTGRGWGLLGMRERITQIGGSIRFSHGEAGGLRIDIEVPSHPA